MSAGPAVGPVAGGAVIDAFGWRAMVGAIVPLSLIVLVMGVFMLKNVGELKNPKLDFASVALSTRGVRRPAVRLLYRFIAWLDQPCGAGLGGCRRGVPRAVCAPSGQA